MIVRLVRPVDAPADAEWLVLAEDGALLDAIRPTLELRRLMEAQAAWFEAEPTDTGWDIKGPIDRRG